MRLPEQLAGPRKSLDELAALVDADQQALERLLRASAAVGLCVEGDDSLYRLSEAGDLLRADAPGSAAEWLTLMTQPWMSRTWEALPAAVRTGTSPFAEIHGCGFWDYVAVHPQDAAMFDAAMTSGARGRADDVQAAVDFTGVTTVVDVGGGQGLLAVELVSRHEHLRAVVCDRPEVVDTSPQAPDGCAERVELVAADFFEEVPPGGDLYVLSRIVHDWPDAQAAAILRQCRAAMPREATLCLLGQIAPDPGQLSRSDSLDLAIKDLNMLVLVGGRERRLADYAELLRSAGFEVDRVHSGKACDVIVATGEHSTGAS